MKIVIDIPESVYKVSQLLEVKHDDTIQIPLEVIANGTPHETVTEFADRCKECGKMSRLTQILKKISDDCNNRINCSECEFYDGCRCKIGGIPETWTLEESEEEDGNAKNCNRL